MLSNRRPGTDKYYNVMPMHIQIFSVMLCRKSALLCSTCSLFKKWRSSLRETRVQETSHLMGPEFPSFQHQVLQLVGCHNKTSNIELLGHRTTSWSTCCRFLSGRMRVGQGSTWRAGQPRGLWPIQMLFHPRDRSFSSPMNRLQSKQWSTMHRVAM